MRITNQMMNNTSLSNINKNKTHLDKLNNQLASEKKLTRPSDDPVIAIRALKLRSTVTEVTQYYEKNTNDAKAWLTTTQDAIESVKKVLTSIRAEMTSGATGTNTTDSRNAILSELQSLKKQIYADGNADYAGRTIFTGFRTSTNLTFENDDLKPYLNTATGKYEISYTGIEESFRASDVKDISYVSGRLSYGDDVNNVATSTIVEQDVNTNTVARIRLAYDNLNETEGTEKTLTVKDKDGNETTYKVTVKSQSDDAYIGVPADEAYLIPETGELILGTDVGNTLKDLDDESTISISYDKKIWEAGDLRPEHYFDCVNETDNITFGEHNQEIRYDVTTNQSIQINTHASEVFFHGIGRDVEELISAIGDVESAQRKVNDLNAKLAEATTDAEKKQIQTVIDAANKELTFTSDKLQKMFEEGQTSFSNYLTDVTRAGTQVGTRISRLELIQDRLLDLKTTTSELADENENVELTDIAINVSEAELVYNAALMATGKISQQTLLSYI